MGKINVLLYDLDPQSGVGENLSALLRSNLPFPLQLKHERFGSSDLAKALKQFASVLGNFLPEATFLSLNPKLNPFVPQLCRSFYQTVRKEAILAAILDTNNPEEAAELLNYGVTDLLIPPVRPIHILPRLLWMVRKTQTDPILQAQKEKLGLQHFVGGSPALMKEIVKISAIARTDSTVLITGESGTGKDICARAIHEMSERFQKPFIPVNCVNLPGELLENELFGHEAGAFTSAVTSTKGLIKVAGGGTLFLDEIDLLPLPAQGKLLRFLQNKEAKAVGSDKIETVDLRIIASSNADLEEAVRQMRFREDLFYRLNVIQLRMPALRERDQDVMLLAQHFLVLFAAKFTKAIKGFSSSARQKLLSYDWPGNVRQLQNVMEGAMVFAKSDILTAQDIVLPVRSFGAGHQTLGTLKTQQALDEKAIVRQLLKSSHGNVARASQAAHINLRGFYRLLGKHGINPKDHH